MRYIGVAFRHWPLQPHTAAEILSEPVRRLPRTSTRCWRDAGGGRDPVGWVLIGAGVRFNEAVPSRRRSTTDYAGDDRGKPVWLDTTAEVRLAMLVR